MIKHKNFLNKNLPVQTQRNKQQKMFDLFKRIDKDSKTMPLSL